MEYLSIGIKLCYVFGFFIYAMVNAYKGWDEFKFWAVLGISAAVSGTLS